MPVEELRGPKAYRFSPHFHAASARKLRVEIRKHQRRAEDTALGDLSVFLWCEQPYRLVFRLTAGPHVHTLEHTFAQPGRHGVPQMCTLAHFDDHVVLGVEILEVERAVQFWSGEPGHALDPRAGSSAGPFVTPAGDVVPSSTHRLVAPEPVELFATSLYSNRVRRLMEEELDVQRGRFVREVEWTIVDAGNVYKAHPAGRALHSSTFSAAGVADLQLMVYPRGMGREDDRPYASLLLSAPAGTQLRGTLALGKQVRNFDHLYAERGSFGREKFARWDQMVDKDRVVVRLEIHQASVEWDSGVVKLKSRSGDKPVRAPLAEVRTLTRGPAEELKPSAPRGPHRYGPVRDGGPGKGPLAWLRPVGNPLSQSEPSLRPGTAA